MKGGLAKLNGRSSNKDLIFTMLKKEEILLLLRLENYSKNE